MLSETAEKGKNISLCKIYLYLEMQKLFVNCSKVKLFLYA